MSEPAIESAAVVAPAAASTVNRAGGWPPLMMRAFGLTDRGQVRENNEDQYLIATVRVEVHKVHLEAGDVVLLCSDGLTNMVVDEEIHRILQAETEPEPACRQLLARANEAGGKDNITVIVARFAAVV